MNDNKKLEEAYRDLQRQETPDLWNRIESGLSQRQNTGKPAGISKKRRHGFAFEAGLAAAACLVLVSVGGLFGRLGTGSEKSMEMAEAPQYAETMAAETTWVADAEKNAETWFPETQYEGEPKSMTTKEDGIVYYTELSLQGTPAKVPEGAADYAPSDNWYFTEENLADTELLGEASVNAVSYERDSEGRAQNVVYEIVIDKVLYSEDYVNEGQTILVKSPLIGSGSENGLLYGLKEGGSYILPLKSAQGAYELVFPYAPQIEVTEDTRYLFHNGWKSLVDENCAIVVMTAEAPEDYYYDRMVLRDDSEFLPNLVTLVEAKRRGEKL